jgi:hypothetical protein
MSGPTMSPRLRLGRWRAAHPIASGFASVLLVLGILVAVCAAVIVWAWLAYLGPGPGVADRVRAARDPLVVDIKVINPNPIGARGQVWITLDHDATRDQVNAFW